MIPAPDPPHHHRLGALADPTFAPESDPGSGGTEQPEGRSSVSAQSWRAKNRHREAADRDRTVADGIGACRMKLTKAQRRTLNQLAQSHPDAYLATECIDRGYAQMPQFRARLKSVPCPTCGHPSKEEIADWDVVEALARAGAVAERIKGSGCYYITAEGTAEACR